MLELKNISFSYDSKPVFRNFNLEIPAGQLTCLLGSSGCGKTSILRLIAGLETPQEGEILINNRLVSSAGEILVLPKDRKTGFVFQDLALWPHFDVYKNIAFGLWASKKYDKDTVHQKVLQILDFFELTGHKDKYPHQLSGGQKQLVAIARALILQPDILLMDEPLANLDVVRKRRILEYVKQLQQTFNLTLVYVTHDHAEAFAIADHIVVLNDGRIEAQGSKQEILASDNTFVRYFMD